MKLILITAAVVSTVVTLDAVAAGTITSGTGFGQLLAYACLLYLAGWLWRTGRAEHVTKRDVDQFWLEVEEEADQ